MPEVYDGCPHEVILPEDGRVVELKLWDTVGGDEYAQLRQLVYTPKDSKDLQTSIILICFEVIDTEHTVADNLENVIGPIIWFFLIAKFDI